MWGCVFIFVTFNTFVTLRTLTQCMLQGVDCLFIIPDINVSIVDNHRPFEEGIMLEEVMAIIFFRK